MATGSRTGNSSIDEELAPRVRWIFTRFIEIGSATILAREVAKQGFRTPRGNPITKNFLYRMLNNRAYIGEAVHKDTSYPGEHKALIDRGIWDKVHAILQESPRKRAANTRAETPALLKGLLYGPDGAAFSPTHTRKGDRLYRYYVSQTVLKHGAGACPVARVPAAEIEAAVIDQIRGMLRAPEVVMATWRAAQPDCEGLAEDEVRKALAELDPLWVELFPAEQARIIQLLIERVDIGTDGLKLRFRDKGLDQWRPKSEAWRTRTGKLLHDRADRHRHRSIRGPQAGRSQARHHAGRRDSSTGAESERRQRLAEGLGARVPLAQTAGDWRLLDDRGDRRRREHQPVLCQPGAPHDAAGAGDRGGHPSRASTGRSNDGERNGSISG